LIAIGITIMYTSVGMAFIGGFFTVILTGFSISLLTKKIFWYQRKVMEAKDIRMKRTNEILVGIKYVKMCGTEPKFLENVNQDREQELYWIRKKNLLAAVRTVTFWLCPVILSISVFGCFILFQGNLNPERTFVVLTTIIILQNPLNNIGTVLNDLLQGQVSLERVEKFMFSGEVDTSYINKNKDAHSDIAIKVQNGNFSWNEKSNNNENNRKGVDNLILKNINMTIKKGFFCCYFRRCWKWKNFSFQLSYGRNVI